MNKSKVLPILLVAVATGTTATPASAERRAHIDLAPELGVAGPEAARKIGGGLALRPLPWLEVGLSASFATGRFVFSSEEMASAALVFHRFDRIELLLGARAGHARFTDRSLMGTFSVDFLAIEPLRIDVRYRPTERIELRFAPVVPSAYYAEIWAFSVGPELGVGVIF